MIAKLPAVAYPTAVLALYGILSTAAISLPGEFDISNMALTIVTQIIALGIALDLVELSFALALSPCEYPMAAEASEGDDLVAVLYCCCDDTDLIAIRALEMLENVDIFILDDSETLAQRKIIDDTGYTVVRRSSRIGFKAGNLNNWMTIHGHRYRYFLVLDSDSIVPNCALWDLVRYAEHPENGDVAIVQSCIKARSGNTFQNICGGISPLRHRILRRLHDRIGWSLSHGHNNLHRVEAIMSVNKFDLTASCEDTLISLQLLESNWRIIYVDVQTYECEPRDAFAHRRRTVRRARQTVDVVVRGQNRVRTWLAVLLAQHLIAYLLPGAWLLASILFAFGDRCPDQVVIVRAAVTQARYPWLFQMPAFVLAAIVASVALRFWHWRGVGGAHRDFVRLSLVGAAMVPFVGLHVVQGLFRSLFGGSVKFDPTSRSSRTGLSLGRFIYGMLLTWIVCIGLTGKILLADGHCDWSVGLVPLLVAGSAPCALWWFHRDQIWNRAG